MLDAERFASALRSPNADEPLDHVPGTIDQLTDNVAVLTRPDRCRALLESFFDA